jgi:hypothetical protein
MFKDIIDDYIDIQTIAHDVDDGKHGMLVLPLTR